MVLLEARFIVVYWIQCNHGFQIGVFGTVLAATTGYLSTCRFETYTRLEEQYNSNFFSQVLKFPLTQLEQLVKHAKSFLKYIVKLILK
jgi:hypothetical protein